MRNGTRRYKEVQGGTRIDQYVRAGTCWYVLSLQSRRTDPYGLIRLRFPAGFAAAMLLGCIREQYI